MNKSNLFMYMLKHTTFDEIVTMLPQWHHLDLLHCIILKEFYE